MSESPSSEQAGAAQSPQGESAGQLMVVGPDGQPIGAVVFEGDDDEGSKDLTELVEQPAKVMRIGSMIRQLLEEVKAAPLDEASRNRLREIHQASVKELESGLAPELVEELERLSLPFTDDQTPSEGELRIAQAQLVGWLEGLFHGIQTAMYAQQLSARAQYEQMRRSLPAGSGQPGHPGAQQPPSADPGRDSGPAADNGMYL